MPPVTERGASLKDVALERLDMKGKPVVFYYRKNGQFFCSGYQQAQMLMEKAELDLGHYGADGLFGEDSYTRLLPMYLRSRGINAPRDRITAEVAQALIDNMPPISIKKQLKRIAKEGWFKSLSKQWRQAIIRFVHESDSQSRMNFFQVLSTEIFQNLDPKFQTTGIKYYA